MDFVGEFLANFISYDSRIWRTISGILFKPGVVTREFCAGRRMSFANPFRFFLTVSIVFFLILQLSMQWGDNNIFDDAHLEIKPDERTNDNLLQLTYDKEDNKELLEKMREIEDTMSTDNNLYKKMIINQAIKEIENDSALAVKSTDYNTQKELDQMNYFTGLGEQIEDYFDYSQDNENLTPAQALQNLEHRIDNRNLSRYRKATKLGDIAQEPSQVLSILLPKIPLFLFFFAPMLSLFFWLLYLRRDYTYMEHMVFNFHLLTFIFIAFYFLLAESFLINTNYIASIFFFLIGPFYLYKAMRNFYQQGRFKTIFKFLIINFVFLLLITMSSTLFILASIFLSL